MFDESNLSNCLNLLGARSTDGIFGRLQQAYGETGRYYHDGSHIEECLTHLGAHQKLAERPEEIEAAIWFHDAVYDTKASDNEERSADWASEYLTTAGVGSAIVSRVHAMIIATKTHVAETQDQKLLLDIDLGILGASPAAFERYDQAIREEYSWVPLEQYRSARVVVLKSFLDRSAIYQTQTFADRLERQARDNLSVKINELESKNI